jgi:hypothetical protein
MEEQESQQVGTPPKPAKVLYHYTDQNGLLGILKSGSIWATHIRYLNDSSEYKHGLDIVKRELLEFKLDAGADLVVEGIPNAKQLMESIIRNAISAALCFLDQTPVFVASFFDSPEGSPDTCQQDAGDMLGQWRAYSGGSAGFSIGFDKEALAGCIWQAGEEGGIPIMGRSCIYNAEMQEQYLHGCIAEIGPTVLDYFNRSMADFRENKLPQILEHTKRNILHCPADQLLRQAIEMGTSELKQVFNRDARGFSASMTSHLTRLAIPTVFMKNPAFSDEREWRVAKFCTETPPDVLFRAGKSSLTPYIAIPLPLLHGDGTSLIRRIVVGPSPEIKDAVAAVRMLLESKNYKVKAPGEAAGIEVVPSRIPYRDW